MNERADYNVVLVLNHCDILSTSSLTHNFMEKTAEQILESHCPSMSPLYLDEQGRDFRSRVLKAMDEYADQKLQQSAKTSGTVFFKTTSVCPICGGTGIRKGGPTDSRPDERCSCGTITVLGASICPNCKLEHDVKDCNGYCSASCLQEDC